MADQTFDNMFLAALDMLKGKDPEIIAKNAGVEYDPAGKFFTVVSMNRSVKISYPDYKSEDMAIQWHYLTILHYLSLADGTPLKAQTMSIGGLPGGLARGTKFEKIMSDCLGELIDGKSEEEIITMFAPLGGKAVSSKADISIEVYYLPRFPMTVNIWLPDDEFPASARVLLNESASHYLTVEDVVTAGECLLQGLKNQ